jgi:enterochelin esterase-like enzyme
MRYSVLLPDDYYESKDSYPVLYLLHGMNFGDDWNEYNQNGWLDGGNVKNATKEAVDREDIRGMIVIMPNAYNSFYMNGYLAGLNYENYFFQELVPHVESTYRIENVRSKRAIAGLSMGGYGALYYGTKYRSMFGYVYAMSPAVAVQGSISVSGLIADIENKAELPEITVEIGTEDILLSNVRTFHSELNTMKVEHEYIERPGAHDWVFWTACYPKLLKKIGQYGF